MRQACPNQLHCAMYLLCVLLANPACRRISRSEVDSNSSASEARIAHAQDVLALPHNRYLVVDQFGYRPELPKVAVLANPQRGMNATDSYKPGNSLEIRKVNDNQVVFAAAPRLWNSGATDEASGDQGYLFDFTQLRDPGTYVLVDPEKQVRSYPFSIGKDVYRNVLVAAMRAFYYNRANIRKSAPHACVQSKCWLLGSNYVGPGQDGEARNIHNKGDTKSQRDLTGGWWDAGDVNKYVPSARIPVHQLLTAYWEHPGPFTDDFGIPESGNRLPDVLDEVMVELDWLRKMQPADLNGGVLVKMGNPKSEDSVPDRSKLLRY